MFPNQGFDTTLQTDCWRVTGKGAKMDSTQIADQIKKAELYEAVKQALMRLLDDPQVQQKVSEILWKQIRQKP
jgi:hypothetical protein